jgi:dimethylargininase
LTDLLALTRDLSPRLVDCELTHVARAPIDFERARTEHAAYEDALRALGCEVRRVPPAPEHPDSVFIEDTVVVLDEMAIICRPGAPSRRAETAAVAAVVGALRPVVAITAPATLDGGDVLRAGRRVFVGRSARTNAAGIAQLTDILSPYGYDVAPVDVSGCLHLKTAASLVADDVVLVNADWVDPSALAPLRTIAVDPDEPMAANALRIRDTLVYPAELPRTGARLDALGFRVVRVPAGELAKAEGGVTCCSVIVEVSRAATATAGRSPETPCSS